MNKRITRKRIVISGVVIALTLSFILPITFFSWKPSILFVMYYWSSRKRIRLLCETDHQALLAACREVLKRSDLVTDRRYKASQFPQVIRELGPSAVFMTQDGFLFLGIHGGMNRFGVRAYPEDFKVPFKSFKYGDKELIPGLWYYDEDYLHNPEYDKKIEELLQKRK